MSTNKRNPIYEKIKAKFQVAILTALLIGGIGGYEMATYLGVIQVKEQQVPIQIDRSHIQVRFSPNEQCTQFIIQAIQLAHKSILVQAYSFTCPTIVDALIDAHERGVSISILVDRSQLTARGSKVNQALNAGIPVAVDKVPGIAHNKVMIIDDQYVLTGSFNWTENAAKRNAENLLLIKDQSINKLYRNNWERRASQVEFMRNP